MSDFLGPHGLRYASAGLSITVSRSLLKLTSIESVMPSNHLILCHRFSSCPRSFPGSGSFPMSLHIGWPKYWSFNFSNSPSRKYSGLISFVQLSHLYMTTGKTIGPSDLAQNFPTTELPQDFPLTRQNPQNRGHRLKYFHG